MDHTTQPITKTVRPYRSSSRYIAGSLIAAILGLTGCSTSNSDDSNAASSSQSTAGTSATAQAITSRDELADATHYDSDDTEYDELDVTEIALADQDAQVSGPDSETVAVESAQDENTVTISGSGVYRLSGAYQGQIIVTADDTSAVTVILDNVDISATSGPAINITAADEVTIILADGSTNTLQDGAERPSDESDINYDTPAALFSRADLTLAGSGSLTIDAQLDDGIHSKDGLVIDGPTVSVTAPDDGIIGKDYLVVADGTISVTATDTGIGSDNDEDADRGWLSILDGTLSIATDDDGIKAENAIAIAGGNVTVSKSEEGIEAAHIGISGGEISITSNDDGINASGGYGTESTSTSDPTTSDEATALSESTNTTESSTQPQMDTDRPTRPDDAQEGTDSTDSGSRPARPQGAPDGGGQGGGQGGGAQGPGGMDEAGDQSIAISGGTITVNAGGDGIDSNGSATMSGGTVTVFGPTNDGNGALDVAGSFEITGGTLLAVGSSGMAESPDSSSSQASLATSLSPALTQGSTLVIATEDGQELASVELPKEASHVVFSSPDVTSDTTYQVLNASSGDTSDLSEATVLTEVTAE